MCFDVQAYQNFVAHVNATYGGIYWFFQTAWELAPLFLFFLTIAVLVFETAKWTRVIVLSLALVVVIVPIVGMAMYPGEMSKPLELEVGAEFVFLYFWMAFFSFIIFIAAVFVSMVDAAVIADEKEDLDTQEC